MFGLVDVPDHDPMSHNKWGHMGDFKKPITINGKPTFQFWVDAEGRIRRYVKATGQAQKKQKDVDQEYQQLHPETHAQLTDKSSN
ncbi:MAG: hypothetical protein ACI9X4_002923 [Glaciecola sp.]|jgi:hypothetical protein